mgnify:CR=1 FL=1
MSTKKKILKLIYTIILIIELLIISILYIQKPINEEYKEYLPIFLKVILIIGILFFLSIITYIIENKIINKNQEELDEYNIYPSFDIDLKDKDILYLSTIYNKQKPGKKEILLLIMQLINKKVIDLSCYLKGDKYQYILEKRNLQFSKISSEEQKLINYLFEDSNRVDLLKKVKEIYYKNNAEGVVKKCREFVENIISIKKSKIKHIYQVITTIIAILVIYIGFCSMILIEAQNNYTNSTSVIGKYLLYTIICIIMGFFITIILKRINKIYKYDNDSYLWLCRNFIFFNLLILVSFVFKDYIFIQIVALILYIFTTLTIMIMYNEHICLSEKDIETRERLLSLKAYFKEMQYLKDNAFGSIMTYEECIMYGFLFNITVKINDEFDMLQKHLFDIAKTESKLYIKLFQSNVLK